MLNLIEALRKLEGQTLSSFEFVQDYLQIRFDDAVLTAYTHPVVHFGTRSLRWEDAKYADSLRPLIGVRVVKATLVEQQLVLEFEGRVKLSISFKEEDYRGPEAFELRLSSESSWIIV